MVSSAIHRMQMSKITVFADRGSSHSWTWFADFLERIGEYDARFLDTAGLIDSLRQRSEVVVISGGDGYAIADCLKGQGFARLKEFVYQGGRYVGVCAGAYLPLPSRIEPLREFNLSTTKIDNIDCSPVRRDEPPRVSVPYGSCSIVHPVRGDVEVSSSASTVAAPLYGGPVFAEPEDDEVLLRYTGFGADAEFQIDRVRAEAIMIGRPAAVRSVHGEGTLMLLGPHLEHPDYPEANRILSGLLGLGSSKMREPKGGKEPSPAMARVLADLKVAAMGLEGRSFLVGKKHWDASRFLELIRAIERRASSIGQEDAERVRTDLDAVRRILLRMKVGVESEVDEATIMLVNTTRTCVDSHFRAMVEGR
jgi:glutamine amidotransferase-like uncharacterized protein